jgi:hypothetical protein
MKFFSALIILVATSGGVANAKDPSRARDRKQERDRKRFLRIKQAESARRRRSLAGSMPLCVEGTGDCCIKTVVDSAGGSKSSKTGRIINNAIEGDEVFPGRGCAQVCVPLCAIENAGGPPRVDWTPPPATCVDPQDDNDKVPEWAAAIGACP